jgi:hypothetical protein
MLRVAARLRLSFALALVALLAVPVAAQATLTFVRNPMKPIVLVAADSDSPLRRVAFGTAPRVSPDGELIAYLTPPKGRQQRPHLWLATASGAEPPRWLAVEMAYGDTFAWSPDSTMIACVREEEDGTQRLTLIDVVAGTQRTVARGYFNGVSFSPEGGQLVYGRAPSDRFPPPSDVYRLDLLPPGAVSVAPEAPQKLTRDQRSLNPLWGPRGQIVFARQLGAKQRQYGPKNELFLMNASGRQVRRLTRTEVNPLQIGLVPTEWSADGTRLLAEFTGQDTAYAVTVDPRTGAQRALSANTEVGFIGTALASGGGRVLGWRGGFEPGPGHDVVWVPYDGGRARVLVRNAFEPDWSR